MPEKKRFSPANGTHAMGPVYCGLKENPVAGNGKNDASNRGGIKFERKIEKSNCPGNGVVDACSMVNRIDSCPLEQRMAALKAENEHLKQTYATVLESEREHHNFFQNTREAIVVFDHEMHLLKANPALVGLLGYSRMTDMHNLCLDNIFVEPGILDDLLKELLFTGNAGDFETVLCHRDRNKQWPVVIGSGFVHFDGNGRPKHFEFVFTDISKRKNLEAQLIQVQKFEAIGTLAGGVAHDFNNLLMGIQGRTSLIAMDLSPSHPYLEHTDAIETHIRSAKMLTDQLLGLTMGGKYQVSPMDMNELVRKIATLFGRTKKDLRIHMDLGKGDLVVEADPSQMEQVLLNLLINAWQAMPDGGDIFLETGKTVPHEVLFHLRRAEPGSYVRIRVRDTGIGMNRDTRKRIFDPFFTTKEKSRGTGLGLASAYGIIKNHGGVIAVESEPGRGSTFNIFLPASQKEVALTVLRDAKPNRGSERVLLVDDEDIVIDVARAMLERLGYDVIVAKGGREAVETVKKAVNEIDLVILDMIMPGMDGGKAFGHIRKIAPGMRVMLSSGHALSEQANRIMRSSRCGIIQKPFTIEELSEKVREMLDVPISKETNV